MSRAHPASRFVPLTEGSRLQDVVSRSYLRLTVVSPPSDLSFRQRTRGKFLAIESPVHSFRRYFYQRSELSISHSFPRDDPYDTPYDHTREAA